MPDPALDIPVRAPAATSVDDSILPFEVAALDLRGRVVRLGPAVDTILRAHDYPTPVAKLVGEAIVLTVLLGSALKFEGRFILQTRSDGPVRMLVVDFTTPGKVRACAHFDAERVAGAVAAGAADPGALLGRGHLAMTIDQGPDMNRYQGLVALEGKDLEHAAHEYFLRSEQIPTRPLDRAQRRMLVLTPWRGQHAQELLAGRSRPHGRERGDHGDLRILQFDLSVRAGRGGGRQLTAPYLRHCGRARASPATTTDQLIVRCGCGVSSEKAGMSMSNSSPLAVTMP